MREPKDTEIYPKFEFRLSHRDHAWLKRELANLKDKFGEDGSPRVTHQELLVAALRHGFRHLASRRKLGAPG